MTLADEFARNAEHAGVVVHRGEAAVEGGRATASYGLADTGSVVFEPSPAQPRRTWLDPEVLVVELREDRILGGLDELFARYGTEVPSALVIVTGPSRSADIEQTLVIGVHGPAEVHVVLLPAP